MPTLRGAGEQDATRRKANEKRKKRGARGGRGGVGGGGGETRRDEGVRSEDLRWVARGPSSVLARTEGGADPPCGPSRPPNAREEEGFCLRGTHPLSPRMITFNKVRLRGAAILCLSLCVRLSLSLSVSLSVSVFASANASRGLPVVSRFVSVAAEAVEIPSFKKSENSEEPMGSNSWRRRLSRERLAKNLGQCWCWFTSIHHYYCFLNSSPPPRASFAHHHSATLLKHGSLASGASRLRIHWPPWMCLPGSSRSSHTPLVR